MGRYQPMFMTCPFIFYREIGKKKDLSIDWTPILLDLPLLQVASSAVRPLTKIPHCCTNLHWGFFRPNVVDQPFRFDYESLRLVKSSP